MKDGDYGGNRTLWEAYANTAKKFPNHQHLGTRLKEPNAEGRRPYIWRTYAEVFEMQNQFARGRVISSLIFLKIRSLSFGTMPGSLG